jgi:hypothetical protein
MGESAWEEPVRAQIEVEYAEPDDVVRRLDNDPAVS